HAGDPHVVAVGMPLAILHQHAANLAGVLPSDCGEGLLDIVRVNAGQPVLMTVAHIEGRVHAAQRAPGARVIDDTGLQVGVPDALARAFQRDLPSAFAAIECRRNQPHHGDVLAYPPEPGRVVPEHGHHGAYAAIVSRDAEL